MNPKNQKMTKLELIFFKTGYARTPKVLNITGLLKNWDAKSQCFKIGTPDATIKTSCYLTLRQSIFMSSTHRKVKVEVGRP